jgi:hypothetical protein
MSPPGEPGKDAKMTARNIRNPSGRTALIACGYARATVRPRGESKGRVASAHRSCERARRIAKGRDLAIVEIAAGDSF